MLRSRAASRKLKKDQGDDVEGSIANLLPFMDNRNAIVPYQDALFFCQQFEKLANVIDLKIRRSKT